jgi:hypothetical protein
MVDRGGRSGKVWGATVGGVHLLGQARIRTRLGPCNELVGCGPLQQREAACLDGETHDRAKPNVIVTQRIIWSINDDRSVRQLWESSEDGGKTWTVAFDGNYVRK